MSKRSRIATRGFCFGGVVLVIAASPQSTRSGPPPVRAVGPIVARVKGPVGPVDQVVELSNGTVVLNDIRRQELVLLSPSLERRTVIFGRTPSKEQPRRYPAGGGAVLPLPGDSILFADPRSRTFLVIDGSGKTIRELPFPGGPAPMNGTGSQYALRADESGRIVYWARGVRRCGSDPAAIDSTPVLRAELRALSVDTIAYTRRSLSPCAHGAKPNVRLAPRVLEHFRAMVPPMPSVARRDEWGLLSDGTLAVLRGSDYSIDWIGRRGASRSTPPVIQAAHHLTESEKGAIVDSLRGSYKRITDSVFTHVLPNDPQFKRLAARERAKLSPASLMPHLPRPKDLPDELPQLRGPVRVDASNNLWIPEAAAGLAMPMRRARPSASVYYVVNRSGTITDHVRIPSGSTIVGFGPGVVYLTSREGRGTSLVRAKIR